MKSIQFRILLTTFVSLFFPALPAMPTEAHFNHGELERARRELRNGRYQHAALIFKTQAAAGCPYSQYLLALMLLKGKGVRPDFSAALRLLKCSANQGFVDAQLMLGKLYLMGRGSSFEPKLEEAAFWLRKAAAEGLDSAHELLKQIPGEVPLEQNVSYQMELARVRASQSANQAENGIVSGWEGYGNVVQELDAASGAVSSK